jgi:predicted membrane-bound dolichyl-phosphate-mannose-protein mannosyltransferase
MRNKLFVLIIVVILIHLAFRIYGFRSDYLVSYNPKTFEDAYNNSQWVVVDSKAPVGDDIVYVHAGAQYLQGRDPTTLNAELPPFGKYLIGISAFVFKNHNIFAILSGISALVAFYLLNTLIFKNKIYALIPVLLFSLEPLFFNQLRTALLDLLFLGLLCLTLYFFIQKKFFRSALFLGLVSATKSTASTFPLIIGVSMLYLLITKQYSLIKKYLLTLPIAIVVFLATYIQFFLQGNNFIEFLKVQKWIVDFYAKGAKGSLTAPWEILFTGSYANWWGEVSKVEEWHLGWPVLVLTTAIAIFFVIKTYRKSPLVILSVWVVAYLLFLSLVPAWSRYFLLILPFMYTLTTWLIAERFIKHEKK